jgi:hypothetical protein
MNFRISQRDNWGWGGVIEQLNDYQLLNKTLLHVVI